MEGNQSMEGLFEVLFACFKMKGFDNKGAHTIATAVVENMPNRDDISKLSKDLAEAGKSLVLASFAVYGPNSTTKEFHTYLEEKNKKLGVSAMIGI